MMTNPKDSCTETTPISVSSDDSRNKEEGDKINEDMGQRKPKRGVDSTLGLPPSENRESVSGDIPRPQQSDPLEAVKEKSITLKQEEPSTEPSQGTDNGDDEDVIRLNEALSRLDVKDEDSPEGLSGCSSGSEILTRVPETTSLGSSVDPESDECGDKGSEGLSESSLESDGNVSDNESDIDSDGISSMSDSSLPQDSREQLVARGPTRRHTSQPRHQGKPYDRQPASPYVVTREQNDDLMELVRGSSDGNALSQHSSPQGPLDQTYVDAWQGDIVGNDQSQNASGIFEIGDSDQTYLETLENIVASFEPTNTSDQALSAEYDNFPNNNNVEYLACSPAPMQSTIPIVVGEKLEEEKLKELEAKTKKTKKKTPKTKRGTPKTKQVTPSPSKPSTKSECQSSVQQTPAQQQTPAHVPPGLSPGLDFQPTSAMMEIAMSIIDDDLRRKTVSSASVEQLPPEVSQSWPHGSGIPASHVQMPCYPAQPVQQVQQFPSLSQVQNHQGASFQAPQVQTRIIIPTGTLDGQVLTQQPALPPPTLTQTVSYGTGQSQLLTSQPTMMTRYMLPSSAQHKLTTAGTLGATSYPLFACSFQPVRPVFLSTSNPQGTQTGSNNSDSRFQRIVPKPT